MFFILFWLVLSLFLVFSLALAGIILLQEPKQSGLGDALGGGGGGMDFGNLGGVSSGLNRLTIWIGVIWGLLALALAIIPRG